MPSSPSPTAFPAPPVGPTAGFTPSQPITVHGSQSQTADPCYVDDNDIFNVDNLIDYEPDAPPAAAPSVVPDSQDATNRSDSPTTSSHIGGAGLDVHMDDDQDFIDDGPVPVVNNSQATVDAASLSQEIQALSSIGSTPLPRKRPSPGALAENDDPDYIDEDDNIDDDDLIDVEGVTAGDEHIDNNSGVDTDGDGSKDATSFPVAPNPSASCAPQEDDSECTYPPDGTLFLESYFETTNAGHPNVDGMAARDASASYGIPVGCSRYQMPNWWKPSNEAHVRWAKRAFDDALQLRFASCPLPREFTIFVHINDNESRQKAVDVYTAHSALQLRLMGASLELVGDDAFAQTTLPPPKCGLSISPRYVPARVVFNSPIREEEAKAALQSTFVRSPGIFVIKAWAVYEINKGIAEFNNELVVLLFVPPPPPGRRPAWAPLYTGMSLPITKKQREGIPGFVGELGHEGDTLWFQFRPFWCWGCKGLAIYFHLTASCINTSVNCGLCHRRGHTGFSCPRKTSVDAALAMGTAPLPVPSASLAFPSAPAVPGIAPPSVPSAPAAQPMASAPPPSLPPQSDFTFSYGRFTQTGMATSASDLPDPSSLLHHPIRARGATASALPLAAASAPSAPSGSTPASSTSSSATLTPARGSKRPSSASSSSGVAAALSTSTYVASSAGRSTLRGKGKGKSPAKTANPKTRSSSRSTIRPDGLVQTSLNFGPSAGSSTSPPRPPTTPHSPKRSRLEPNKP
ncbi:hypothetical protein CF326_g7575 [Tilletia indica]|nr:hypothetical protein CF326_g7575 [Tilletia indica]